MHAPWKKSYDQPRQHIKKQRHYFANKGLSSQSYGFSGSHVWMWELDYKENWAPKNWCFWTVVLEKTLESPLDCKEIHQSILKEMSPEYSLEGLMLKLKLQNFGHLIQRTDSLEKTLMLGKIEGGRRTEWHRMRWLDGITELMDMNLNNLQELVTEQLSSFVQLCDSMDCSTPGLSVHYQLLGLTQTHVHRVSDAIQPSHPLSSPSPPTFNLSQHQSLFQWVNSSHEVSKVLEFQHQHHSFQRIPRIDL